MMNSYDHSGSSSGVNTGNEEEPIYLSSSDDDDNTARSRGNVGGTGGGQRGYNAYEDDFEPEESFDDFMDDEENGGSPMSGHRRPIKVYDEYDPENIDNGEETDIFEEDDTSASSVRNKKQMTVSNVMSNSEEDEDSNSSARSSDSDEPLVNKVKKRQMAASSNRASSSTQPPPAKSVKPASDKQPSKPKSIDTAKTTVKADASKKETSKSQTVKPGEHSKPKSSSTDAAPPIKRKSSVDAQKDAGVNKSKQPVAAVKSDQQKSSSKSNSKSSNSETDKSGKLLNLSSGFKIPKRASPDNSSSIEPPEKRSKTEERPKDKSSPSSSLEKTKKPITDKPSAAKPTVTTTSAPKPVSTTKPIKTTSDLTKLIPTKPKVTTKPEFQESGAFMDALSSRPVRPPKPTTIKPPMPPTRKASLDTTDPTSSNNQKHQSSHQSIDSNASRTNNINESENKLLVGQTDSEAKLLNIGDLKASATDAASTSLSTKTRKKVSWADTHHSKQLETVSFFYLDEAEREIKKSAFKSSTGGAEFRDGDIKKIEMLNEKGLRYKMGVDYNIDEENGNNRAANSSVLWTLQPIELPSTIVRAEIKSEEREVQAKREQNVLQCFLTKEYLPDSPGEPPIDHIALCLSIKTSLIPLEDLSQAGATVVPITATNGDIFDDKTLDTEFYNPSKSKETQPAFDPSKLASLTTSLVDTNNLKHILNIINKTDSSAEPTNSLTLNLDHVGQDVDLRHYDAGNTPDSPIISPTTNNKRSSRWNSDTDSWSPSPNEHKNGGNYKSFGNNNSSESYQDKNFGNGRNVFGNSSQFRRGIAHNSRGGGSNFRGNFNNNNNKNFNNDRGHNNNHRNFNNNNRPFERKFFNNNNKNRRDEDDSRQTQSRQKPDRIGVEQTASASSTSTKPALSIVTPVSTTSSGGKWI